MTKEYADAVARAQTNYEDALERGDEALGGDVLEYLDSILTPEEIAETDLRAALIGEPVRAREEKGITQQQLEELSGVRQPVIARVEKGQVSTQLTTILKILAPLGKTLAVVPIARGAQ